MIQEIAPVMITVDREPKTNYLSRTLHNLLLRQGIYMSPNLQIFDSRPGGFAQSVVFNLGLADQVHIDTPTETRCANLNVAAALRGGAFSSDWVLFLEDDIDVCGYFIDSVLAWLSDHVTEEYQVYPLGANYMDVISRYHEVKTSWKYPIEKFYGTQAFALRSEDALNLAEFLERDPYHFNEEGTSWDLIMHLWSKHKYPDSDHFLTPCPSFVQHIGRNSTVKPRDDVHIFPSFPGPYWVYESRKQVAV